jgi:hypothetical protein
MNSYIDLLMDELLLSRINPVGNLESLRECLLHEIELEHKLQQHLKKLQHCSKLEQCLILQLHKIPCILHLENHVGLKLLKMLLKEGFDNVKEGHYLGHIRSQTERIMTYIKQIEAIFNNTIFGDDDGPAQWALSYHNTKNVAIICLDNN